MHPNPNTPAGHHSASQGTDRLTRRLVGVALVLLIIVVGLGVSVLSSGGQGDETASAAGETATALALAPSPIPTTAPTAVPITPPPCVAPEDWTAHVIQTGDTLYSLAQRYGTTVDTLMLVNCLETETIFVDQQLRVPGPTPSPVEEAIASPGGQPASQPSTASQALPTVDLGAGFPQRYLNIVLLGSDKRDDDATWRTDTIIVLSIDNQSNFVRLLSIPRDLWVNIPGHGYDRVNTADLWGEVAQEGGGPELVKQTISENLGIPIHYYVRVDFDGFMKIIDAVGGLDIDVDCPLPDIELAPGMSHMDGEMALLFARSRITTSDFDRSNRQRKLLMALWDQGLSVDVIPRLPALSIAMADTLQTDMPFDRIVALAYKGLQLKPSMIFSNSIGPWQVENWTTPEGASVLLPVEDEVQKLLATFYSDPNLAFLEQIGKTRIQVLNGSPRQDAEQLAATKLRWAGFGVSATGLADRLDYAQSEVRVYRASPDMAELVAQALDLPRSSLQYLDDPGSPVDMQVIIGADYDPCSPH
jgi:LCP family protein required for cell wall assembly